MTAKRGRPRKEATQARGGYRFRDSTIEALRELVAHYRSEVAFLNLSERALIEASIHHVKRLKDAGQLPYSVLFGLPAETAAAVTQED